jgi:hypothetical protein
MAKEICAANLKGNNAQDDIFSERLRPAELGYLEILTNS